MAMTPAKRHQIRAMYEAQQQDRKNSRLVISLPISKLFYKESRKLKI